MKSQFKKSAIVSALPVLALGAMMIPGTACDEDNPLCCSQDNFQIGGSIDVGGSANAQVAVQAIADFAGVATVMLDDITAACRNIALDLGATGEDANAKVGGDITKEKDKGKVATAWCELAVTKIGEFKAGATLTVSWDPPKCSVSASASLDCKAGCEVEGECSASAKAKCSGSMEVSCSGECTAEGNVALECTGSCDATCEGSCQAQGGVDCKGKCDGTCEGKAGVGEGVKADGTCEGTCKGTCEVTAPGASCSGSCSGKCSGKCKAEAGVEVKCNGKCSVDATPLKCEGELEAACKVNVDCGASCDASASAKAECTPPKIEISFTGGAEAKLGRLKATLQANLGVFATADVKLKKMATLGGTLAGKLDGLLDIKVACIPPVIAAMTGAVENVTKSVEVTGKIVASVK